jgi:type II secretion system protein H
MKRRRHRQIGFSLIEIAVVLALMALLASVAAVSARGMIGGATQQDLLAQLRSLDAQARRQSQQTGQTIRLELDTDANRMTLTKPGTKGEALIAQYGLPGGYKLTQAWSWRRGQRDNQNPLVLLYDAQGVAPSWGVTLTGPDEDDEVALLVLGATGQAVELENDEQAQDILAQVHRRDAD